MSGGRCTLTCNYPRGINNTGVNEMTLGMQNLYAVASSSHNPIFARHLLSCLNKEKNQQWPVNT